MTSVLKRLSVVLLTAALTIAMLPMGFAETAYADAEGTYSAEGTMTFHTNGGTLDVGEGAVEDPEVAFSILLKQEYAEESEEYYYVPDEECAAALEILMTNSPTREGHLFGGWYADESLDTPVGDDYMGIPWTDTDNAYHVYAKWVARNGWAFLDDSWYYFDNGTMIKSTWKKDSKGWCYLGADGRMVTNGWAKDSKGWCWLASNGYMPTTTKWIQYDGGWYHITKGYRDANKWMKDSKGWCWLQDDGRMLTNGWAKDSKGWCWIGSDGYMVVKSQWINDRGSWYYISNGYMVSSQWRKDSKGWCYLGSNGKMVTNGWAKDSKGWCWIGASGYMVTTTGWMEDKGEVYYLYKGYCASDDRGMPKKPDDTVPTTISGVTEENTYYFDGSTTGTNGVEGDDSTYNLKTVLAMSTPTKVVLRGTIQFTERYKVGSNTEIDAEGATLYCASNLNDGCLTNWVPSCNYNAIQNVIVRGGYWKKETGYHEHTMFLFIHGNNIRIEDAKIECSYDGHCIELVACKDVVVKRCDMRMFTGTPGEDEPMQIDHASKVTTPTITNLNPNAANGHACKNVQVMDCTMIGGRGVTSGHAGNDPICANVYHENVYIENNYIEGKGAEGCALFNVHNAVVSGNTIKATGGKVDKVSSCALHVQIPQNSKAPSDMNKTSVIITNNKCYGGRNGILVYSHSDYKSKFGKVYIFDNKVWYKGTDTAAINWGGWDHNAGKSFDGVPNLTLANNTLKKGW